MSENEEGGIESDPPQTPDQVEHDKPFVEPEEPGHSSGEGVLRVTSGALKIPEGIVTGEEPEEERQSMMVLLLIVGFSILFIAFIAWLIANGNG
jgi:hypothetical protein